MQSIDIEIQGSGFYAIMGASDAGKEWINDNVQTADNGTAYTDERRCAKDIADGAIDAGLVVTVDGRPYSNT